jgi:3-oxoacyl-[acyl-carrier protein] reductase
MVFQLRDKVVVITGASSGIGEAVARRLAKEGTKLVLAARREDRLQALATEIQAVGGTTLAVPTDVRQLEDINRLFSRTLEQWGRVDILLNNAGVSYDQPLIKVAPALLREELEVNLLGVVACAQAALKPMLKQRSGHIVNVASIAGLIGLPGSTIYNASKFGVVGFSEALGREVGRFGVRVSAFCPGFVATDFSPRLKSIHEKQPGAQRLPGVMDVVYVADQVAWLIQHPRRRYIIPHSWNILVWAARTFPWGTDWIVNRFV